jgi:16S rRNA (uracil1498-N3)-methyltransferase
MRWSRRPVSSAPRRSSRSPASARSFAFRAIAPRRAAPIGKASAAAASEQCGRARVTRVLPVTAFATWLGSLSEASRERRIVLSFAASALDPESAFGAALAPHASPAAQRDSVVVLSGPEGGLAPAEEDDAAVRAGFVRVGLGPRVLRADTAPLALLAWLALRGQGPVEP